MQNNNSHLIKFVLNKELGELYASVALRSLALSITGIFVPLYLLVELGHSLNKVLVFFIISSFVWMLLVPVSAKIMFRIGIKYTLLLSVIFFIIFYLMLLMLEYKSALFYYVAIISGISPPLFWTSFHLDFIRSSDRGHRGEEVSIYYFLAFVTTLIGPLVGGLVLTYYGFTILFIVVSLVIILSALPLFFSEESYKGSRFGFSEIF